MTFVATVAAILYAGAKPVLVDIDPRTRRWTRRRLAPPSRRAPRRSLPVHLHGRLADMDPIMTLADAHGLVVIEDAAQAHGAISRGRRVGVDRRRRLLQLLSRQEPRRLRRRRGDCHHDAGLAEAVRRLRDWGQSEKYLHDGAGLQLPHGRAPGGLPAGQAAAPRSLDRGAPTARGVLRPAADGHAASAPATAGGPIPRLPCLRGPARRPRRGSARHAGQGIATDIHYPDAGASAAGLCRPGYGRGDFPVAESSAAETLSLPMYPELTRRQVETVAAALSEHMVRHDHGSCSACAPNALPSHAARIVAAVHGLDGG